jgi:hypothetical protein
MKYHRGSLAATIGFFGIVLLAPVPTPAQRAPARFVGGMLRTPRRTFPRPAVRRLAPVAGVRTNVGRSIDRSAPALRGSGTRQRNDVAGFDGGFAGAPLNIQELLNITPTSGFTWEHVNAINRDLPEKALIDPVTQLEIAQAERLLRTTGGAGFGGGGAYLVGGYPYYIPTESEAEANAVSEPVQAEAGAAPNSRPQIIVLQQAPPQPAEVTSAQPAVPATPGTTSEQQVPDRGELTLVLRDGRHIKALAFSHVSNEIVYITPDGGRTTIEAADLDSSATVRVNQEEGTPLRLPR